MALSIAQVRSPTDDVRALIGELDAELASAYTPDQRHGLDITQIFRSNVAFFVAHLDGEAVGCGGVAVGHGFAELKRMYVRPGVRGRSIARAILARLEEEALRCGATRLMLETGDAQGAAIRFYEREGFTRCGAFGPYAAMSPVAIERSVFFEKRIR
jgi:putative acetyltransferase